MTINKKILIHHIELSKTSLNISGGERALIEIVDYFDKKGIENIIYTSESGKILYNNIKNFNNVAFIEIGPIKYEKINGYFAYFLRFFQLFFKIRKFNNNYKNIILTHEDFVPSTLFSFLLKNINSKAKWYMIYHMKCPDLFRGYRGEFTGQFFFPDLRLIRYWLEQRITFLITKKLDKIITVNSYHISYLSKFYPKNKIYALKHFGGLEYEREKIKDNYEKKYDLIFMARFHPQKGLFDLIKIITECKKIIPDIKLVVLGGGNERLEMNFKCSIKANNLEGNILYKGFVSEDLKYEYIQQSNIFLMPSYYESFPVVFFEVMSFGLPFITYDLPVYFPIKKAIVKVKIGDISSMSEKIINLLKDKKLLETMQIDARLFSANYSWQKTGKEIYYLFRN